MVFLASATTAGRSRAGFAIDPVSLPDDRNTSNLGVRVRDGLAETLLIVRERLSSGAIVLRGTLKLLLTDGRSTAVGRAGFAGRAGAERDGRDTDCGFRSRDTPGILGAVGRGIVTLFSLGTRWI